MNVLFSDETIFKHDSLETRFIPLTINIGELTEVKIDFQKTKSWILSSWHSSSWTFPKITVLNGDQQQRYIDNINMYLFHFLYSLVKLSV
jgi:hypothetical protein